MSCDDDASGRFEEYRVARCDYARALAIAAFSERPASPSLIRPTGVLATLQYLRHDALDIMPRRRFLLVVDSGDGFLAHTPAALA